MAINVDVRAQANLDDLIKDIKATASGTKILNKELNKLVNQFTSLSTSMNAQNRAMKEMMQATARLNKEKQQQYITNKRLIQSETLVNALYTKNSAVAQKRYLTNLGDLRRGLERFNREAKNVVVMQGRTATMMDESANAMTRFMIKGNMVSRTLDTMANRALNAGKNFQWTGRQMMVGISLPLIGIAAASLRFAKASGEVDRQLKRVVEGGAASLKVLNDSAIELSNTWGVNVEQIKALQVEFAQAGFDVSSIKSLTRMTQEFSVIGDVAVDSAKSLVQSLALTGKSAEDLTLTLAKLNLIDDETSLSMQDVADALPKIVPIFKAYGGTVEQAAALLAGFTDNSIDAVEGANAIKAVLTKVTPAMAAFSGAAVPGTRLVGLRQALTEMSKMTGIDLGLVDQNGKMRTSLDVLVQLAAATKELGVTVAGQTNLAPIYREMFGATQASRGITLMNELGEAIESTAGSANGMAKAMEIANAVPGSPEAIALLKEYERQLNVTLQDPWMKFQQSIQKLRNVAIDFGLNHVLPVAQQLLEKITGLIEKFSGLSKGTKDLIIKFGLAAIALGPLIYGMGQFVIMGATVAQMLFTKPLKALFRMGNYVKSLGDDAGDARDEVDRLMAAYRGGDITREELKRGIEGAQASAAKLRLQTEGNTVALKQGAKAAADIADETDKIVNNSGRYAKTFSRPMLALPPGSYGPPEPGPMHGPSAPGRFAGPGWPMGAGRGTSSGQTFPMGTTGWHALGPGPRQFKSSPYGQAFSTGKMHGPPIPAVQIQNVAARLEQQALGAAEEAKKSLDVLRGKNIWPQIDRAGKKLGETAKKLGDMVDVTKVSKSDWEKIVPVLIANTAITEEQLSNAQFMERLITQIKNDLPRRRTRADQSSGLGRPTGAGIRSERNIKKLLEDSNKYGKRGFNIKESFPGSRALGGMVDDFVVKAKAALGVPGDIGGGKKGILPQPIIEAWVGQYKDELAEVLMKDVDTEQYREAARAQMDELRVAFDEERAKVFSDYDQKRAAYREQVSAIRGRRRGLKKDLDRFAMQLGRRTRGFKKLERELEEEFANTVFPDKASKSKARSTLKRMIDREARERGRGTKEFGQVLKVVNDAEKKAVREARQNVEQAKVDSEKSLRELNQTYRKNVDSIANFSAKARSDANSQATTHLHSLLKGHRETDTKKAKASGDALIKKLTAGKKIRGRASDPISDDILKTIITDMAKTNMPMGQMLAEGKVPKGLVNKVAANLFSGNTTKDLVSDISQEFGLTYRVAQSVEFKRFINLLQDELAVLAGAERVMLNRMRSEAASSRVRGVAGHTELGDLIAQVGNVQGLELMRGTDFEELVGRGDVDMAFKAQLWRLQQRLQILQAQRLAILRNSGRWIKSFTATKIAELAAAKADLVREWAHANRMIQQFSTLSQSDMMTMRALPPGFQAFGALGPGFQPFGELGQGPMPAIRAWMASQPRALPSGPRIMGELGMGARGFEQLGPPPMMELGPGDSSGGLLPARYIDVQEVIDGKTRPAMDRLQGSFNRVRGAGEKLFGQGGPLNVKHWLGFGGAVDDSVKKVSRLSKAGASLNQLAAGITGFTLVGEGGLVTLFKTALPIIGILAAIAAGIYLIWKNWDEVGPHVVEGLKAIKDAAKNVFDAFVGPFRTMFGIMGNGDKKSKEMSETWKSIGKIMSQAMKLAALALNILAPIVGAVAHGLAGIAYIISGMLGLFSQLSGGVQLVVVAFTALQFAFVRTALGNLVQGFINLIARLIGVSVAAGKAAVGMSLLNAATSVALVALMGISMGVQSLADAQQRGADAANEYWAAVSGKHDLGATQNLHDVEQAWEDASADFNKLNEEYERQKQRQGGDSLGGQIARAWGALPGVGSNSDDERKIALQMEADLKRRKELLDQLTSEYKNQKASLIALKYTYGITEKQALDFAAANNIDMRWETEDVLDKFKDKWEELKESGKDPFTPEVDPAQLEQAQEELSKLEEKWSEFQSQLRKVVDDWKNAALEAFDEWANSQIENIDKQIEAINDLSKAEDQAQRHREYLRRREELAQKRKDLNSRYVTDRAQAIYEGRYDDAAMLDMDFERDSADLDEEIAQFEEDHQRELTRIARDEQIQRLNDLKESKRKEFEATKKNLQLQLDEITRFLPRNKAAAEAMQAAIIGAMTNAAPGYKTAALTAHHAWRSNWDSAWAETHKHLEDQAWWAGRAALEQFAAGAGVTVDANAVKPPTTGVKLRSEMDTGAIGNRTTLPRTPEAIVGKIFHTGGKVGNPAGGPQDVDATLQTGEFVVQRKAVAKYGTEFLSDLNEGQVYHAGGVVRKGLSKLLGGAVNKFNAGEGAIGGITLEKLHAAYSNALGGVSGGGGSTVGKSVADIVDNMISGIHPEFKKRLQKWNSEMGGRFDITHGYRSMSEQAYLYDRWLRRVPGQAQAAPPGSSMHNFGLAVDLKPSSTNAAQRAAGAKYGLRWPMSFEPWHVEPIEAKAWRTAILAGSMPAALAGGGDSGGISAVAGLFGPGTGGGFNAAGGDAKSIVRSMMSQYGWGDGFWPALERLVQKESSWNPMADNPTSSAAGLFQKMTSIHGPLEPTIQGQAQWGLNYIKQRYGDPIKALAFHDRNNWYHEGGLAQLRDGGRTLNDGIAKLHRGETVVTAPLSKELIDGIRNLNNGGPNVTIEIGHFYGTDREIEKLGKEIERVMAKTKQAKGQMPRTFTSR